MAISDEIELFLRNALREKALEDRLIRQAISDLRQTLLAVERLVGQSGSLALGPNRDSAIRAVSTAVARSVQQTWGAPTLGSLQEALAPFVEQQLSFARQMVEAAGGTLTSEGAASLQVRQVVNNAVINGKTLADTLTAVVPAQVADKVERYIRLGLSDVGGEVVATYQDAVVRTVERNVEAIIRTGVHEVGNAAQQAIYEFETDPDWINEAGLMWTAVLDSAVCPICIGLDGKVFPVSYRKVSVHPQCRCFLIPAKWRTEDMTSPSGEQVAAKRPAQGDSGEQTVSFKRAAKTWVKDNPETARDIFGVRLGNQLVKGDISFDKAVKQWTAKR
jgi:SPP1 gp7 family putative phage head morphogenesis protein